MSRSKIIVILTLALSGELAFSADACDSESLLIRLATTAQCRDSDGPSGCLAMALGIGAVAKSTQGRGLALNKGIADLLKSEPRAQAFLSDVQKAVAEHARDYARYVADPKSKMTMPKLDERLEKVRVEHKPLLGRSPFAMDVLDVAKVQSALEVTIKHRLEIGRLRAKLAVERENLQKRAAAGKNSGLTPAMQKVLEDGMAKEDAHLKKLEKTFEGREQLHRKDLAKLERRVVRQSRMGSAARVGAAAAVALALTAGETLASQAKLTSCEPKLKNPDINLLSGVLAYRKGVVGECDQAEIDVEGVLELSKRLSQSGGEISPEMCATLNAVAQRAGKHTSDEDIQLVGTPQCEPMSYQVKVNGRPVEIRYNYKGGNSELIGQFIAGAKESENEYRVEAKSGPEGQRWGRPEVKTLAWNDPLRAGSHSAMEFTRHYREYCGNVPEMTQKDLTYVDSIAEQRCSVGRTLFVAQHSLPEVQLYCAAHTGGELPKGPEGSTGRTPSEATH